MSSSFLLPPIPPQCGIENFDTLEVVDAVYSYFPNRRKLLPQDFEEIFTCEGEFVDVAEMPPIMGQLLK